MSWRRWQRQTGDEDYRSGRRRCAENERRGSERGNRKRQVTDARLQSADAGSGERPGELHPLPEEVSFVGEVRKSSARSAQAPARSVSNCSKTKEEVMKKVLSGIAIVAMLG